MRAALISHTYVEPENRGKLEALVRAGVQLTAFVPSSWRESALQKEWTVTADRSGNLEIVPVPVRRTFKSPAGALWNLQRLNERLSRSELDLIQVEEEPWSVAARRAVRLARRNGIPSVIFTWQNLSGHPPWPLSALARRTLRLADGWIAGNEAGKKLLARIDPSHPLTVLPQLGVSLPSEPLPLHRPQHPGPLRVAFVGRLVEEKGVTDLIDAVANMQRPCTLTILGEGPARGTLEAQAHGHGIIGVESFHPRSPQVSQRFHPRTVGREPVQRFPQGCRVALRHDETGVANHVGDSAAGRSNDGDTVRPGFDEHVAELLGPARCRAGG